MKTGNTVRKPLFFGSLAAAVVCMAAAAVLFLGGEDMDPSVKSVFDAANIAFAEGDFPKAESAYAKANLLASGNPQILRQLGLLALYENRVQDAERFFQEALQAAPWYTNIWPLTSDLKYRLSMVYYRQDRFADAAPLMKEAVGPLALGPLKDLQGFQKQMELFGDETPYRIDGPDETKVDFLRTDPLPLIEVSCNGSEKKKFVIDTGGAEVILDREWAQEIGAEIAGSLVGTYAGGKKAATGLGRIASLQLGDFIVHNLPIHTLDTTSMSQVFDGTEIHGIIGTRLLMHFLSTIDYASGALVLRRSTVENLRQMDQLLAETDAKTIPFWLVDLHVIVARGSVNNLAPSLFFVDTGLAGKGFTASEDVLEKAGIAVDWSKGKQEIGGGGYALFTDILVERLTLGEGQNQIVATDVPGSAIKDSTSILLGSLGFHVGGLISHQFFRPYAVTFDFANMRLIVH
jgi:tetratricopeptide (TPR) repeat protein